MQNCCISEPRLHLGRQASKTWTNRSRGLPFENYLVWNSQTIKFGWLAGKMKSWISIRIQTAKLKSHENENSIFVMVNSGRWSQDFLVGTEIWNAFWSNQCSYVIYWCTCLQIIFSIHSQESTLCPYCDNYECLLFQCCHFDDNVACKKCFILLTV
jgi:hypothetical protein